MGGISSSISVEDALGFSEKSGFSVKEVRALYQHFQTISINCPTISKTQFQAALLFQDSVLIDRMFSAFDVDEDGQISFSEYLACLSIISQTASREEKLLFSFRLYDFDSDGFLSITDLTTTLASTLREHGLVLSRADLDQIVESTMQEIDPAVPGQISFEEYKKMVKAHPHTLDHLSLNIPGIISEYSSSNGVSFSTPRNF